MALLLADRFPSTSALFSGRRFHSCLLKVKDKEEKEEVWTKHWVGASAGLDHGVFSVEKTKRIRKDRGPKDSHAGAVQQYAAPGKGLFSVLEMGG